MVCCVSFSNKQFVYENRDSNDVKTSLSSFLTNVKTKDINRLATLFDFYMYTEDIEINESNENDRETEHCKTNCTKCSENNIFSVSVENNKLYINNCII